MEATINEVWNEFERVHTGRRKGLGEYRRLYLRHVAPGLGDSTFESIHPRTIGELHDSLHATPTQANRVLAVISKLHSFARRRGRISHAHQNPCSLVERYPERSRSRHASMEELERIKQVLASETGRSAILLKCLILTGARPSELTGARREHLDGDVIRLPDSKNGTARNIYLNRQARELIGQLAESKDGTLFGVSAQAAAKLWRQLRVKAGVPDMRMYPDLRRSFATVAVAAGVSIDQIGGLLGHKSRQTTLIYARLMEGAAHKAAQQAGDFMEI